MVPQLGMLRPGRVKRLGGGTRGCAERQRSARGLNKTQGHRDGLTEPKLSRYKAGNDCDASDAGLQGARGRR